MDSTHNILNPAHFAINPLRRIVHRLGFREQGLDVFDTVCQNAFLQATVALSIGKDCLHIAMAQNILLIFIVKHIMLHFVFLLISVFVAVVFLFFVDMFESFTDHAIHNSLLFFIHGFDDFCDSLAAFGLLFFSHFGFLLGLALLFISVIDFNRFISIDDSLIIRLFSMLHDRIDKGTRISTSQNQTNLTNITMSYASTSIML